MPVYTNAAEIAQYGDTETPIQINILGKDAHNFDNCCGLKHLEQAQNFHRLELTLETLLGTYIEITSRKAGNRK